MKMTCHVCQEPMSSKIFGKDGHAIEHKNKMIQVKQVWVCDGCGTYYYDEFKGKLLGNQE